MKSFPVLILLTLASSRPTATQVPHYENEEQVPVQMEESVNNSQIHDDSANNGLEMETRPTTTVLVETNDNFLHLSTTATEIQSLPTPASIEEESSHQIQEDSNSLMADLTMRLWRLHHERSVPAILQRGVDPPGDTSFLSRESTDSDNPALPSGTRRGMDPPDDISFLGNDDNADSSLHGQSASSHWYNPQ